jgi:hypothetical protein
MFKNNHNDLSTGFHMKHQDSWQESVLLTMDQFFIGTGWHEIQKVGQQFYRWTGPDPVSTMQLSPRRDLNNRLNITIRQAFNEDSLKKIQLKADGVPLKLTLGKERSPAYITAVLPKDTSVQEGDKTVLSIHVPEAIVPAERNAKSQDMRQLGLCIQQVKIFPLKRPMFTVQKFSEPRPFDGLFFLRYNTCVRDAVIHGLYKSAYEYFLKNSMDMQDEEAFQLHENFDECPGDLYDIIQNEMLSQYNNIIKKQQEEIAILREVAYRQSDDLIYLRKQIPSQK